MLFQHISLVFLLFVNINQSINCISISTIINPFNWYSFPPADLPVSSSNSTDQANVSKYLQLIQSLFPKKMIGKQESVTTETTMAPSSITYATTEFQNPTTISTVDDRSTITDIIKSKLKDSLTISTTPLNSFLILKYSNNPDIDFENDSVVEAITTAVNDNDANLIMTTTPVSIPLNTIDKMLMIADNNTNDALRLTNQPSEQLNESQSNARMETIAPSPTTTTTMAAINNEIYDKDGNQQQARSLQEPEKETTSTIGSVKFVDNEMITTTEQASPSQLTSLLESMTADPILNVSELNPETMIMKNNGNDNNSIMSTTSDSKLKDTINTESSIKYSGEQTSTTMKTDENFSKIEDNLNVRKQSISNMIDFNPTTTSTSPLIGISTVDSISIEADRFKSTESILIDVIENRIQEILNNKSNTFDDLLEDIPIDNKTASLLNKLNNINAESSSTMIMNDSNDDNEDSNNFIRKFHDAYYSNSAIFDDLMKRYSNERSNRAMRHFDSNDERKIELTANDIETINRLFFENRDPTINFENF